MTYKLFYQVVTIAACSAALLGLFAVQIATVVGVA